MQQLCGIWVFSMLKRRLSNVPCRTSGLPLTNRLSVVVLLCVSCFVILLVFSRCQHDHPASKHKYWQASAADKHSVSQGIHSLCILHNRLVSKSSTHLCSLWTIGLSANTSSVSHVLSLHTWDTLRPFAFIWLNHTTKHKYNHVFQ